MQVNEYIFQSPYASPVQVGRPDPSSQQSADSTKSDETSLSKSSSQTLDNQKEQNNTLVSGAKAKGINQNSIDIYA